ncbi:MAG TPA: hypothetical protein VGS19_09285 [Streptosporangiaceae bacterium]|nr:hypothetical protein [Streptosporangiaceae bacterium]
MAPLTRALSRTALSYAGPATVAGQSAWELNLTGGGKLLVSSKGTPFPLELAIHGSQFDFSQWNSAPKPTTPPESKIFHT